MSPGGLQGDLATRFATIEPKMGALGRGLGEAIHAVSENPRHALSCLRIFAEGVARTIFNDCAGDPGRDDLQEMLDKIVRRGLRAT